MMAGVLSIVLLGLVQRGRAEPIQGDKTRNPFGVADVKNPDGKDVQ